ncbi:uncharacterized protein [Clytia hemisphaerica]|uniref:Rel homology dimerisation domain-containing protein n=1 Tax=Clytia hemisphaerica TaxID=252671 RepID=A0A7M5XHS3_9CNID|eukprot:TCONS_00035023-protein
MLIIELLDLDKDQLHDGFEVKKKLVRFDENTKQVELNIHLVPRKSLTAIKDEILGRFMSVISPNAPTPFNLSQNEISDATGTKLFKGRKDVSALRTKIEEEKKRIMKGGRLRFTVYEEDDPTQSVQAQIISKPILNGVELKTLKLLFPGNDQENHITASCKGGDEVWINIDIKHPTKKKSVKVHFQANNGWKHTQTESVLGNVVVICKVPKYQDDIRIGKRVEATIQFSLMEGPTNLSNPMIFYYVPEEICQDNHLKRMAATSIDENFQRDLRAVKKPKVNYPDTSNVTLQQVAKEMQHYSSVNGTELHDSTPGPSSITTQHNAPSTGPPFVQTPLKTNWTSQNTYVHGQLLATIQQIGVSTSSSDVVQKPDASASVHRIPYKDGEQMDPGASLSFNSELSVLSNEEEKHSQIETTHHQRDVNGKQAHDTSILIGNPSSADALSVVQDSSDKDPQITPSGLTLFGPNKEVTQGSIKPNDYPQKVFSDVPQSSRTLSNTNFAFPDQIKVFQQQKSNESQAPVDNRNVGNAQSGNFIVTMATIDSGYVPLLPTNEQTNQTHNQDTVLQDFLRPFEHGTPENDPFPTQTSTTSTNEKTPSFLKILEDVKEIGTAEYNGKSFASLLADSIMMSDDENKIDFQIN